MISTGHLCSGCVLTFLCSLCREEEETTVLYRGMVGDCAEWAGGGDCAEWVGGGDRGWW